MILLAKSSLSFQFLAKKDFAELIELAQLAPSTPQLLNPVTARRRLQSMVKEGQERVLLDLPPTAKLSIALDCWTSPFQQAFMAITGYFIDKDWKYRETLLGFEPLHGAHSGVNLSTILMELLQKYDIVKRVLAITTDNASNNNTLIENIQEPIQSLRLPNQALIVRIPCLAHVIQLSLRDLLGRIKANPKKTTQAGSGRILRNSPFAAVGVDTSTLPQVSANIHNRSLAAFSFCGHLRDRLSIISRF